MKFNPFDLIGLLQGYSAWVRHAMILSALGWFVVMFLLMYFEPGKGLIIDAIERVRLADPSRLGLDVRLRNTSGAIANILSSNIKIGTPPEAGLLSSESISSSYEISSDPKSRDLLVKKAGEPLRKTVNVNRPYAGVDFFELRIPVSNAIEDKKTDRVLLVFDARLSQMMEKKKTEFVFIYNNNQETPAFLLGQ